MESIMSYGLTIVTLAQHLSHRHGISHTHTHTQQTDWQTPAAAADSVTLSAHAQ